MQWTFKTAKVVQDEGIVMRTALLVVSSVLALAACDASKPSSPATAAEPDASDLKLGAEGVTAANLAAYAYAKLAFIPKDEFSKDFDDTPLAGRAFKLQIPVVSNKDSSSVSYSYDADKEELTISLLPEAPSLHREDGARGSEYSYLIFKSDKTIGAPQDMANAFGMTKPVTPVFTTLFGVGSYGNDAMGAVPRHMDMYSLAQKVIRMAPDQARAATASMYVEISGKVRKSTEGRIIECEETEKKATLDYNYEEHWKQCVISSKIDRIVVTSPSAGTIAVWPSKGDRTPGKYETIG